MCGLEFSLSLAFYKKHISTFNFFGSSRIPPIHMDAHIKHTYLTLEVFIVLWSFQTVKLALMKESASNIFEIQPGNRAVDNLSSSLFLQIPTPPPRLCQLYASSSDSQGSQWLPSLLSFSLFPPSPVCVAFGKLANCVLLTWVHVLSGDQLFV